MIRTLRAPVEFRPPLSADLARRAVLGWRRWRSLRPELIAWREAAWRGRWLGLGVASMVFLVGWTATLLLPNQYRSSALLFADPGRGVVLEGSIDAWTAAALAALRDALRAAQGPGAAASDRTDRLAERIAIATEGPALFRISYRAAQPDAAERTLQALIDLVTSGRVGPGLRSGPFLAGPQSELSIAAALQTWRDQGAALRNDLAAALALRNLRSRQLAEVPPVLATGRGNPAYDQAAMALGQQETLVAGLRHQLAAAEDAIATLEEQLEAGSGDPASPAEPGIRRLAAPAADAAGLVFRMIGPPSPPPGPESPLRLMLLAAVAAAGIGVGTAVAVWRGQLDGIVNSTSQLGRRFQLPVLGAISAPSPPGQRRRQRRSGVEFGLACLGLLVLFGGLATAEALDLLAPLTVPAWVAAAG